MPDSIDTLSLSQVITADSAARAAASSFSSGPVSVITQFDGPLSSMVDAEAHVQARDGVPLDLGSQGEEGGTQLSGCGRCGHQRADDGKVQARPSITFREIGNLLQCRLQMRPHRWCDSTGAKARQPRRAWLRACCSG